MIQLPFLPKQYHKMGHFIYQEQEFHKLPEAIAPSNLKPNSIPDVSSYQGNVDWSKDTSPAVICKAGEWGKEDDSFGANWTQLGQLGKPRAAYWFMHFNQPFYTSGRQANTFVAILKKYGFTVNDYVILDAEEKDSKGQSLLSATQMLDFLYNVQVGLGLPSTKRLLIYSTAGLLDDLSWAKLNVAQVAIMRSYRIWSAGYPFNPSQFDTIPPTYVPNAPWGPVVLWQYSDSITPYGDESIATPAFLQEWAGFVQPAPYPFPVPAPVPPPVVIVPPPAPTPAPEPIPAQLPSFGQPGVYSLKIRGLEYNEGNDHPAIGTFAAIGARSQSSWIQFGKDVISFIKSFVHNAQLWNWAAQPGYSTIYIHRNLLTVQWPMLLMSSSVNRRQTVRIDAFETDHQGRVWAHVHAIPKSVNYSGYTPDKYPEYFFWCYTIYPDGHVGEESHNGMTFLMPIFDPASGFKVSAGNTNFWVDANILKEVVRA